MWDSKKARRDPEQETKKPRDKWRNGRFSSEVWRWKFDDQGGCTRGIGFGPNNEFWRRYGETRTRRYGETRNREIIEFNHWNRFEGIKRIQYSLCRVNLIQEQSEWERNRATLNRSRGNELGKAESHSLTWRLFVTSSMHAAIFLGIDYSENLRSVRNTEKKPNIQMLFDVTQKFARDQKLEISGVSELSWRTSTWEKLVLADDREVIKLMKANVYVFSYSALCVGKLREFPKSNAEWKRRMSWFRDTYQCRELDGIHGEPLEFEWKMRISVKESLVHFRISDKSVFECWSRFAYFKNCKIQPIINLLLILEPRSSPITVCGIFVVIPIAAVHRSVDSARCVPNKDSAFPLVFSVKRIRKSSRSSS